MSSTLTPLPGAHTDRSDALVTRLFEANLATYDLATIYLGDRLGLYTALQARGSDDRRPACRAYEDT